MEDRIYEEKMQEKIMIAANLLGLGMLTNEAIAEATKLPLEKVEEIAAELNSVKA